MLCAEETSVTQKEKIRQYGFDMKITGYLKRIGTPLLGTAVSIGILVTAMPAEAAARIKVTGKIQPVNEYTVDDSEAFTSEELRKFLDENNMVNNNGPAGEFGEGFDSDKERSEMLWKQFMELSINEVPEEEAPEEETEEVKDEELSEQTKPKYYVPPKGEEWKILLVNKQNPIPDDYDAQLVNINGSAQIRREAAVPLAQMFDAAAADGVRLTVCSAYRSHEHQQELFDAKIRNYTRQGMSYLDAFRIGSYSVIIPGTSEHELGLALDIVTPGYTSLSEGFADTAAGRWLEVNAYKYGFILRYPKGKEYITGITFEPWHFRYVGEEVARDIYSNGLTLEEYTDEIGWQDGL